STHILSEVEQTCERVIIIAKGRLVATDTVENLTSRLHGSETVALEVMPRDGAPSEQSDLDQFSQSVGRKLEQVSGVSRVMHKESRNGRVFFTVESLQGRQIRPELARAIIDSGWNLNELHAVGLSLEEIFLQLTAAPKELEAAPETAEPAPVGEQA